VNYLWALKKDMIMYKIILFILCISFIQVTAAEHKNTIAPKSQVIVIKNKNRFFVNLLFGKSFLRYTNNVFNSELINGAKEHTYLALEAAIGYHYDNNLFSTFAYQRSSSDFTKIENITFTINYQLSYKNTTPYVGLLIGNSFLSWKEDPIINASIRDTTSSSLFLGAEAGLIYTLTKKSSIVAKIQYIKYSHSTQINNEFFNHSKQTNFMIGVKYELW
jgi:hypothetical protein